MRKVGIITIYGNDNLGNKLQNFALQTYIEKNFDCECETIKNYPPLNNRKISFVDLLKYIKIKLLELKSKKYFLRRKLFNYFDKQYIKYNKRRFSFRRDVNNNFSYDVLVVGSDQVWNPDYRLKEFDLGLFGNNKNKIAYAASLSAEELPNNINKKKIKDGLDLFKGIAVREYKGKELLEKITTRNDIEVLVDPTMLLEREKWEEIVKRPNWLNNNKFILLYFLGEISEERKNIINNYAKDNDFEIINITDKNSKYYEIGPREFLYLEKNAEYILTDSFHSSVFALIFKTPFSIFNRDRKNIQNMNSRFDTLIKKFNLKNVLYDGKINNDKEIFEENFNSFETIIKEEQKKSFCFLKRLLNEEK